MKYKDRRIHRGIDRLYIYACIEEWLAYMDGHEWFMTAECMVTWWIGRYGCMN